MHEKINKESAQSFDATEHTLLSVNAQKHFSQDVHEQNLLVLQDLQGLKKTTHNALQNLREHQAQKRYSSHVYTLAKDVYDNLLFSQSSELVNDIKAELSAQLQKNFLFRFKLGESEVCILEEIEGEYLELINEDKEEIFSCLWNITLQKIEDIVQSVSAQRKDTIMNIKKTSFSSSPFAQVGGAKSSQLSKAYATNQVSGSSPVNETQATAKTDTIHVSTEGILRTEAYKTAQTSPDTRQIKINEIKDKIASGTYKIDTKQLAFNLLREEASLLM